MSKEALKTNNAELRAIIEKQQEGKENTPEYMVGLQLLDIAEHESESAELLLKDLAIPEMSLSAAAKQLKAYADKNRGKSACFCITPMVAEGILRNFYGLPERADTAPEEPAPSASAPDYIDLTDFL